MSKPQRRHAFRSRLIKVERFDLFSGGALFALSVLLFLPIILRGFPSGDDAHIHYRWASEFIEELKAGSLYPRWLSAANYGYGSPAMLFYPPLQFYVVAGFSLLTGEVLPALVLSCWLALVLSGLLMYRFSRSFLSRQAALIAAIIYMVAPYHLYDLYQGSALAEFWAFAWLPLLLYAVRQVVESDTWKDVTLLALSYGLLLFTHIPTSLSVSLLLPVYILVLTRDFRKLLRVAIGLLLGIGLSAIFVLPVLLERKYVHINVMLGADYKALFLFRNLLETFKRMPFPNVVNGETLVYWNANWVATATFALFVCSVVLLFKLQRRNNHQRGNNKPLLAVFLLTSGPFFLQTRLSLVVWKIISVLAWLQFPFRLLLIASAGTAVLAGAAMAALPRLPRLRLLFIALFAIVMVFVFSVSTLTITRATFPLESFATGEVPEYQPIWTTDERPQGLRRRTSIVDEGEATITPLVDRGIRQRYSIEAHSPSLVRFHTYFFPGWVAQLDGMPTTIKPADDGSIMLSVNEGEHLLTLAFADTPPRIAGKIISSASVLIVLFLSFWFHRQNKGE